MRRPSAWACRTADGARCRGGTACLALPTGRLCGLEGRYMKRRDIRSRVCEGPARPSRCRTQGSEVISERDAELSDVVEIVVRMLAVGEEDANGHPEYAQSSSRSPFVVKNALLGHHETAEPAGKRYRTPDWTTDLRGKAAVFPNVSFVRNQDGHCVSGMKMCADPEHGLGVGDRFAGAKDIRAGMGA